MDWSSVFATFPILETERLILRAVTPDDTASIFELMGDERVTRYLGRFPLASLEEAVQRVNVYESVFQDQTGIVWAITPRDEDRVIGTCLVWNLQKQHFRAELGYAIVPDWWGKGITTEANTAALNFAFTTMGLHSMAAIIDPANDASRHVLEKLGFVQEGYFREDYYNPVLEQFTDTAIFSLLKANWLTRRA